MMKQMFNLVASVFIFVVCLVSPYQVRAAEVIDRVVAVVNDDLITQSELREMALSLDPTSTEQIDEATILQKMAEQRLFEQEAEKLGIKITQEELDASIKGVQQRFSLNDEQMVDALKKQGLTPEDFREQWRSQTLVNKLIESQLKVVITDEEIKEYYEDNYGGFTTETPPSGSHETFQIAHVLISTETPNALDKAEEVANLARSGNNFADLARERSEDIVTANKGGILGFFRKGDLMGELEAAVATTPEGGIAGPVKSSSGYHVIKVLQRSKGGKDKDSDIGGVLIDEAIKQEIKQTLYRQKAEKQLKEWLDRIKENAYVEIKL